MSCPVRNNPNGAKAGLSRGGAIISLFVEKIFLAIRLKIPSFFVQGICRQMIEFPR